MSIPLGMVCKGCGDVIGSIIAPDVNELPQAMEFACVKCIGAARQKIGVVPDSAETWAKVVAEIRGRR